MKSSPFWYRLAFAALQLGERTYESESLSLPYDSNE